MGYRKLKLLGKGAFGSVYLVNKDDDKTKKFALKQCFYSNDFIDYENEVRILKLANSEFIVKIFEVYKNKNSINILMEYADDGTLYNKILSHKSLHRKFNFEELKRYTMGIANGLDHLHKLKIVHRDIKPENILLFKGDGVKLADFGVSKITSTLNQAVTMIGTPYYLSPELIQGKKYSFPVDYWGLGCILYEMVTFYKPFNSTNPNGLYHKILKTKQIMTYVNPKYKDIITGLLEKKPSLRYSYSKVKNFFENEPKNDNKPVRLYSHNYVSTYQNDFVNKRRWNY